MCECCKVLRDLFMVMVDKSVQALVKERCVCGHLVQITKETADVS